MALLMLCIGSVAAFWLYDDVKDAFRINDGIDRCLDETSSKYIKDYDDRLKACGPTPD